MPLAAGEIERDALRMMRHLAHQDFDRLWAVDVPGVTIGYQYTNRCQRALRREWPKRRSAAYAWLAGKLGLAADACHFSRFDRETLERAMELCRAATPEEVCGRAAKAKAA